MTRSPDIDDRSERLRSGASRWSAWAPVVLYMGILFTLSAQSKLPEAPGALLSWDKMQHVLGYAGLMLLAYRAAVLCPFIRSPGALAQAFLITTVYGALDEIHQSAVPGRSAEVLDWLADAGGAVLGAFIIVAYRRLRGEWRDVSCRKTMI